jgi:hypothetical protein
MSQASYQFAFALAATSSTRRPPKRADDIINAHISFCLRRDENLGTWSEEAAAQFKARRNA